MTAQDDAIEVAVAAVLTGYTPVADRETEALIRQDVERAIAAAAPVIRADERERTLTTELRSIIDIEARQALTDLRARVEGLRDRGLGTVLRSDVLALFEGGPSDEG